MREDSLDCDSITADLRKERRGKIWAIGGGKGGVGKSLLAANTSICLAIMGHKVVSIDLDLGGANLHTCLGVSIPEATLSDYLTKKVPHFQDLLTPTVIDNLSIISGAQDEVGMANLRQVQKNKILAQLGQLDADYILLDLGAGTSYNTLDFFISADQGILTALPEPTSIENTYRFIRSIYHRKLKIAEELLGAGPLIDQVLNAKIDSQVTPAELVAQAVAIDQGLGAQLKREVENFTPKLVINQTRTQSDIDIGHSMRIICKKYFGINLDYVGHLDYDPAVWQSVKKRRPLLIEYPNSALVGSFDKIVMNLLNFS